jgi:hypothetical protein
MPDHESAGMQLMQRFGRIVFSDIPMGFEALQVEPVLQNAPMGEIAPIESRMRVFELDDETAWIGLGQRLRHAVQS